MRNFRKVRILTHVNFWKSLNFLDVRNPFNVIPKRSNSPNCRMHFYVDAPAFFHECWGKRSEKEKDYSNRRENKEKSGRKNEQKKIKL